LNTTISLPRTVIERAKKEAMRLGISIEEYFLELISQGIDPKERSIGYIEASSELVEQAEKELRSGNVRQAAERVWGAAALAVKAYAYWKEPEISKSWGAMGVYEGDGEGDWPMG